MDDILGIIALTIIMSCVATSVNIFLVPVKSSCFLVVLFWWGFYFLKDLNFG